MHEPFLYKGSNISAESQLRIKVMHPPRRCPPSAQEERLHALVSRLDDLRMMRTMELARVQQLHGEALRSVANVLKALQDEIARLCEAIREHIDHDPDLRHQAALLESIPGLGQ